MKNRYTQLALFDNNEIWAPHFPSGVWDTAKNCKRGDGGLTPFYALGTKPSNLVCFFGCTDKWVYASVSNLHLCVCLCRSPLSDAGRVEDRGIDRALAWNRETVPGSQPASAVRLIDLHYFLRVKLEQEKVGRSGPYIDTGTHAAHTTKIVHIHICTHWLYSHSNLSDYVGTKSELR